MIKKWKDLPSLTKYVVFSIAILLIYSVAEFVSKGMHDTLTTCVYACFGGEILSCALIKIFKLKEQPQEQSSDHSPIPIPIQNDVISEEELNNILNNMYKEENTDANG